MLFYLLAFLMVAFLIAANLRPQQRTLPHKRPFLTADRLSVMLVCLILFLILALQDAYANADLMSYYTRYRSLQNYSFQSFLRQLEDMKDPVYYLAGYLFGKLGLNFYVWKAFISFVFVLGLYKLVLYHSANIYVSFIALLSLGLYGFAFSGLRQTMAFGILFFAYPYLKNRKLLRFILVVVLAALFHSTALIFLAAYPIYRLNLRLRNILILLAIGGVVLLNANPIANLYLQLMGTDEIYAEYLESGNVLSMSGIIISGSIWLFCTVFLSRRNASKFDEHLCNLSLLALFGRILSTVWFAEFFRVSMYFSIFEFLMIADACASKEKSSFVVRVKTAGVSLVLVAYYLMSPSLNIMSYVLR